MFQLKSWVFTGVAFSVLPALKATATDLAVSLGRLVGQGGNRVGAILYDNAKQLVKDLNKLYVHRPALHARDHQAGGFTWMVVSNIDIGAGSVAVSAAPALPKTVINSGTCFSRAFCSCKIREASCVVCPVELIVRHSTAPPDAKISAGSGRPLYSLAMTKPYAPASRITILGRGASIVPVVERAPELGGVGPDQHGRQSTDDRINAHPHSPH